MHCFCSIAEIARISRILRYCVSSPHPVNVSYRQHRQGCLRRHHHRWYLFCHRQRNASNSYVSHIERPPDHLTAGQRSSSWQLEGSGFYVRLPLGWGCHWQLDCHPHPKPPLETSKRKPPSVDAIGSGCQRSPRIPLNDVQVPATIVSCSGAVIPGRLSGAPSAKATPVDCVWHSDSKESLRIDLLTNRRFRDHWSKDNDADVRNYQLPLRRLLGLLHLQWQMLCQIHKAKQDIHNKYYVRSFLKLRRDAIKVCIKVLKN